MWMSDEGSYHRFAYMFAVASVTHESCSNRIGPDSTSKALYASVVCQLFWSCAVVDHSNVSSKQWDSSIGGDSQPICLAA